MRKKWDDDDEEKLQLENASVECRINIPHKFLFRCIANATLPMDVGTQNILNISAHLWFSAKTTHINHCIPFAHEHCTRWKEIKNSYYETTIVSFESMVKLHCRIFFFRWKHNQSQLKWIDYITTVERCKKSQPFDLRQLWHYPL